MPLYDCMFLFKPQVQKEHMMDLISKVGKHVYRRNGVPTDIKSFKTVQLGYGIKKLDGRYFQGKLVQMTVMAPPSINNELHYLNKEDRLLRWLLIKHREVKFGVEFLSEDAKTELRKFRSNLYEDEDVDDDDDDDDDEYEVNQVEIKEN